MRSPLDRDRCSYPTTALKGLNNMLVGFPTKAAYALCTFAYSAGPQWEPILFEGRTDGQIVPARGEGNFGWDACFEPKGFQQTYVRSPLSYIAR